MPISCLPTGLGVALGSPWVVLCSPLSDLSFQLSAFQLLPNCGLGVALMSHWVACWPDSPVTHHASRNTHPSSFGCWMLDVPVNGLMSPWVALCSPLSDFSFQLSAFQLLPNCGFRVALISPRVAFSGGSRFHPGRCADSNPGSPQWPGRRRV